MRESVASLAHHVSSVVVNARRHLAALHEVARLRGLTREPEDILAQATGMLMARHGWTAESALAHIQAGARGKGQSVYEVAGLVVAGVTREQL